VKPCVPTQDPPKTKQNKNSTKTHNQTNKEKKPIQMK
jgi:hypothetical protein